MAAVVGLRGSLENVMFPAYVFDTRFDHRYDRRCDLHDKRNLAPQLRDIKLGKCVER